MWSFMTALSSLLQFMASVMFHGISQTRHSYWMGAVLCLMEPRYMEPAMTTNNQVLWAELPPENLAQQAEMRALTKALELE